MFNAFSLSWVNNVVNYTLLWCNFFAWKSGSVKFWTHIMSVSGVMEYVKHKIDPKLLHKENSGVIWETKSDVWTIIWEKRATSAAWYKGASGEMCVTKKRLCAVIQLTDILSLFVQKTFVAHNYIYIFKHTLWLKMTCPSQT